MENFDKVMAFDYCAIPIFVIILFTTFVRKTTKGATNHWFIAVVLVSLVTNLVDLLADGYEKYLPLSDSLKHLVYLANYIYFAMRNLTPVIYLYFLFSVTRASYRMLKIWRKALMWIPFGFLMTILFTNPFHHMMFTVTNELGYQRGTLLYVFYAISIGYSIFGVIYLFSCFRFLTVGKWIALISMYFLSFIGIAIQFFYPQVLIEIFTTAISLLLIILMVLRPEEITDINVGLPSWKAYQYELYKISKTKKHTVRINVINYTNANQVREYLGEEKFYEYIRSIAQSTENLIKREKLDITMFYESPAIFYFLLDGNSVNTDLTKQFNELSQTIQKDTKENEENGISLTPTLCSFLFPDEINDVDDAIDMGHFFSKMLPEGKNCIMASEITETTQYKLATNMSMILDRAFAKNKFEMYYQPIYDFADKKYHSAEALIRLTDDEYGRIPPSIFIPAAEKNGVILKIGDFVLESVFKFVSENDIQKLGLQYIEINLSVAQCLQLNLLDKIFELQQKYKVSPSNINFEITETTYGDNERIKQNIKKLVQMGYSFSLDDYGTGYSNIQRTAQLPLSLIKIDKSLVDEIVNEQGHSIVKNTIAMMKDIKKSVLAEGVETKEQLDLLREMGCDYIQGFYFSKPLPMDDFVSFLECHNS